jgi:hypothetical protein
MAPKDRGENRMEIEWNNPFSITLKFGPKVGLIYFFQ